jgi:hypothetical protein
MTTEACLFRFDTTSGETRPALHRGEPVSRRGTGDDGPVSPAARARRSLPAEVRRVAMVDQTAFGEAVRAVAVTV